MGWFGSDPFIDARLGTFERSGGAWNAVADLGTLGRVPLRLAGDRKAPDPRNLALSREVSAQFDALRATIAQALYEHLEPYAAAITSGELDAEGFDPAAVRSPGDALACAAIALVDIDATRVDFPVEVQLQVPWDVEHTLGARLRDGALVELSGSV